MAIKRRIGRVNKDTLQKTGKPSKPVKIKKIKKPDTASEKQQIVANASAAFMYKYRSLMESNSDMVYGRAIELSMEHALFGFHGEGEPLRRIERIGIADHLRKNIKV